MFIGGAISIDRSVRQLGKDLDIFEKVIYDKKAIDNIIENLKSKNSKIDIIVTHTAPDFCFPYKFNSIVNHYINVENNDYKYSKQNLSNELNSERRLLTKIYNYFKTVDYWFYGHFHESSSEKINNTLFRCLDIDEIYELK